MDKLQAIFECQKQYIESLKPIERQNGFTPPDYPLDIDNRHHQEHLRLLAWRINEEIYEAMQESGEAERIEEIADILHFVVELCLSIDFYPAQSLEEFRFINSNLAPDNSFVFLRTELAYAMMSLKQRPWRLDHRPTNKDLFREFVKNIFDRFLLVARAHRLTADDLYDAFFAKAKINDARQQSQQA